MLKVSYTDFPDLFLVISAQFTVEMCAAAKNGKKIAKNCKQNILKTSIVGVQSYRRC